MITCPACNNNLGAHLFTTSLQNVFYCSNKMCPLITPSHYFFVELSPQTEDIVGYGIPLVHKNVLYYLKSQLHPTGRYDIPGTNTIIELDDGFPDFECLVRVDTFFPYPATNTIEECHKILERLLKLGVYQ